MSETIDDKTIIACREAMERAERAETRVKALEVALREALDIASVYVLESMRHNDADDNTEDDINDRGNLQRVRQLERGFFTDPVRGYGYVVTITRRD